MSRYPWKHRQVMNVEQLKALIVDDERHARDWLVRLLASQPEIDVVAQADGVDSALETLAEDDIDVIFLDIHIPPRSGFEVLPYLKPDTRIIFVTAYDEFAIRAFEANALDYLLKPVHPERLAEAVGRALVQQRPAIQSRIHPLQSKTGEPQAFSTDALDLCDLLPLKDRNVLRMVSVNNISAIQAHGAYTRIYIPSVPPMMMLCAISEWEAKLPSPPFARLDRSHIINLTHIEEAVTVDRNRTCLRLRELEADFDLGRAASQRLRSLLSTPG